MIIFYGKEIKESYCECGNKISCKKALKCVTCSNLKRRKVKNRPSKEELIEELKNSNFVQVGKKYGVSDNAIRKWLK